MFVLIYDIFKIGDGIQLCLKKFQQSSSKLGTKYLVEKYLKKYFIIMLSQYSRGGPGTGRLSPPVHTLAIWTFPFHYYSLKNVMIF